MTWSEHLIKALGSYLGPDYTVTLGRSALLAGYELNVRRGPWIYRRVYGTGTPIPYLGLLAEQIKAAFLDHRQLVHPLDAYLYSKDGKKTPPPAERNKMKFHEGQIVFVDGLRGKIVGVDLGDGTHQPIYDILLNGDTQPTEFFEREIRGSVRPKERLYRSLKSLSAPTQKLKGAYLGKAHDNWDRYEVNQLALDPPRPPKPMPERKPKPFVRETVDTTARFRQTPGESTLKGGRK